MHSPDATLPEMIEIMQAALHGAPIQSRPFSDPIEKWNADPAPSWNWREMVYRVDPAARAAIVAGDTIHPLPTTSPNPIAYRLIRKVFDSKAVALQGLFRVATGTMVEEEWRTLPDHYE